MTAITSCCHQNKMSQVLPFDWASENGFSGFSDQVRLA
jgi:hypothetical protein